MKSFFFPFFLTLVLGAGPAAQPTVSNVTAQQREGTKLVDVSYDLAIEGGENTSTFITFKVSKDGGTTVELVPGDELSGASGGGISAENGKSIFWNASRTNLGGSPSSGREGRDYGSNRYDSSRRRFD